MKHRPGSGVALALLLLLTHTTPLFAAGGELPRIVNFTIMAVVLIVLLRKPLADFLTAKAAEIRQQLSDAAAKTASAATQKQEAEALLASLDEQVEKAKQEAREAAEAERQRVIRLAEEEAARIREITRKEIDGELETARRQLLARAAELSVELAQKKLETAMTDQDRETLIDRSIGLLGETQ